VYSPRFNPLELSRDHGTRKFAPDGNLVRRMLWGNGTSLDVCDGMTVMLFLSDPIGPE
jgi:hypothetical protein